MELTHKNPHELIYQPEAKAECEAFAALDAAARTHILMHLREAKDAAHGRSEAFNSSQFLKKFNSLGQPKRVSPHGALKGLSQALKEHGLTALNEIIWHTALHEPSASDPYNPQRSRMSYLDQTLGKLSDVLERRHLETPRLPRSESATWAYRLMSGLLSIKGDIQYLNLKTLTPKQITMIAKHFTLYLNALNPHEQRDLYFFASNGQKHYLTPSAQKNLGDSLDYPFVRQMLKAMLIYTPDKGIAVESDLTQIQRRLSHLTGYTDTAMKDAGITR